MRHCDLVFCVDATGAMGSVWGSLPDDIPDAIEAARYRFEKAGYEPLSFRVRIVGFRDFRVDPEAIFESRFYQVPEEYEELFAFTRGVWAHGGGDLPEDAFEGLAVALRSEFFCEEGDMRVVVLVSDGPPHPLGTHADCPGYPEDMPTSLDTLRAQVEGDPRLRLLLFAPLGWGEWQKTVDWENTFCTNIDVGRCLEEVDFADLLTAVLESLVPPTRA